MLKNEVKVPVDVPKDKVEEYLKNYNLATNGSGRLFLFAGDQKVEHLNDDFYGPGVSPEDNDPEHLFKIASKSKIGAFATQLGLIARYAMDYPEVNYIVKINSKTHLVKTSQMDPISTAWVDVEDVIKFKEQTGLKIVGVGYTIYPGSEYEYIMLREAAKIVNQAHKHGLLVVIWSYPRGKAVKDERDAHLIAGAAGLAACLGADFVKVNPPKNSEGKEDASLLKEAVLAAGRTKVICAGGKSVEVKEFLQKLYDQIQVGISGNATGRNIHQKPLEEAIRFCNAIYAITVKNYTVDEAMKIYEGKASL
ncbi:MAG: aldolase [bacterium]|jgi:fructose-bisphosphate aldolase/6-deoxy-5-ketofructose 1-phosphate synthase